MKLADDTVILDMVSPGVRKLLVGERVRAMRGRLADAVAALDGALVFHAGGADADVVALGLLKAELLHLNRDEAAALDTLKSVVIPRKDRLPQPVHFTVE